MKRSSLVVTCFFLLIGILGCAHIQPSEESSQARSQRGLVVSLENDLNLDQEAERPSVVVGSSDADQFGPRPLSQSNGPTTDSYRDPIIAILTIPALYRSLYYLGFMDQLNTRDLNFQMLATNELGVLLQGFFSLGYNVNRIEWEFFRLLGQLRGRAPYSRRWRAELTQFIEEYFTGLRLEQGLQKNLVLVRDKSTGNKMIFDRGAALAPFTAQLSLTPSRRQGPYISATGWDGFSLDDVFSKGADIVIILDALASKIALEDRNEALEETYIRVSQYARHLRSRSLNDSRVLYVHFTVDGTYLDQTTDLPLMVQRGREMADMLTPEIVELVEKWKNKRAN